MKQWLYFVTQGHKAMLICATSLQDLIKNIDEERAESDRKIKDLERACADLQDKNSDSQKRIKDLEEHYMILSRASGPVLVPEEPKPKLIKARTMTDFRKLVSDEGLSAHLGQM